MSATTLELLPTAERYPVDSAVREARKELMREATRAGITNESIGQWMNLAWRHLSAPADLDRARECAQRAVNIHFQWGPRLGEGFMFAPGGTTLQVAVERFGAVLPRC
jgi:hypothetical protein